MNLVWHQAPIATSEIVEQLAARNDWHPRTIRTLLDRLVKKGALTHAVDGKRYLYRAKVSMDACVRKASQNLLERVFGGEPAAMLIHLVKQTKFSAEEIKELQRILQEKRE
jgi:BlaI family penicillinase repressor